MKITRVAPSAVPMLTAEQVASYSTEELRDRLADARELDLALVELAGGKATRGRVALELDYRDATLGSWITQRPTEPEFAEDLVDELQRWEEDRYYEWLADNQHRTMGPNPFGLKDDE